MTTANTGFNNLYPNATLIGLWDFSPSDPTADTGLGDGVAQDGAFKNGAYANWMGDLITSGRCDQRFEVGGDDTPFDLGQGSIVLEFRQFAQKCGQGDTLVSRGTFDDRATEGFLDIRTTTNGAVELYHSAGGEVATASTSACFFNKGDSVEVTYSWSATGGALKVANLTTGGEETIDIAESLTLDIGDDQDPSFIFGARAKSDDRIDHEFDGAIDYVAVYDSNVVNAATPLNGLVEGTDGDDLIDLNYDGDPQGDKIDNHDALSPLRPNQDIVRGFGGNDIIYGEADDDFLYGDEDNDEVYGQDGNDQLYGGTGNDFLSGGEGQDIVSGDDGDDVISGDNQVAGDAGDLLYGGQDSDTFVDIGQNDFVDGGEDADGKDCDVLDLTGAGETVNPGGGYATVTYDPNNHENGTVNFFKADGTQTGSSQFINIEKVIGAQICFTPGTIIATPKGERLVETLNVGDRVITRDNGIQEIRWIGKKSLSQTQLRAAPHLRPILIKAGSLGDGLPERDMMLSPNHRVLMAGEMTPVYFEDSEVLVAAKHLKGLPGIDVVDVPQTTYIHVLFDNHEVILSDGAWTESFQPGDYSMAGLGKVQRSEIYTLFPELETNEGLMEYTAARRALKRHEARVLFS